METFGAKKLGFGFMRLPTLEDSKRIDNKKTSEMVDYYIENGFTYFDTAYNYHSGFSENAIRENLTDRYDRSKYLLADKMPPWEIKTKDDYKRIFKGQLKKCNVEYFDRYLMHNMCRKYHETVAQTEGMDFLTSIKKEGRAKLIGFSFHDSPQVLDEFLYRYPQVDFVQLQLNYADWERANIQSRKCYETARKHGKEVLVMEPIKGGSLADLGENINKIFKQANPDLSIASWAIRYAASLEGVAVVLSGMSTLQQIKDNVSYMKDFKPLNEEEYATVQRVVDAIKDSTAIGCTDCKYCTDTCPEKINIPALFSLYNMVEQFGDTFSAMHYDRATRYCGKASDCIECATCEGRCPQHLNIIENLKIIAEKFEK